MNAVWMIVGAYISSGLAGVIYEVCWTRLLTLYMGHTTAAAATVLAAFMGGMALGAAIGGRLAALMHARRALRAYAALECTAIAGALAIPIVLRIAVPFLATAYADGGVAFSILRFAVCALLLVPPAAALGATFPCAVQAVTPFAVVPGRFAGVLYAANTAGAAGGSLLAGFLLIPAIGLFGATAVAMAAGALAATATLSVSMAQRPYDAAPRPAAPRASPSRRSRRQRASAGKPAGAQWTLAAVVLGATGFATFVFEIGWTRVLSMVLGPSTYAFAAMLAAVIASFALGAFAGPPIAARTRNAGAPLAAALACAIAASVWSTRFAGDGLPQIVLQDLAQSPDALDVARLCSLVALVVAPPAMALGAAFPLALALATGEERHVTLRLGLLYGINTIAAMCGSLAAGFLLIPLVGLQRTLECGTIVLTLALATLGAAGRLGRAGRLICIASAVAALLVAALAPPWNHDLIASGIYKYARLVAAAGDTEAALTAGRLVYYREGAAATVTVKRLTGSLSLAIDGKVDASNAGDMLTQKTLAHLPLLLHPDPHEVCIIGLGSGVTAAAALVHPVDRVDVVEISPEVVEASRFFDKDTGNPLSDPRTHLIVGDGRSHLLLSPRKYDVIVSEPSNPWMAGVSPLFTREFFTAARSRLAPKGVLCQWAHTYDISSDDLRSIVATFASVFPGGTMWLIGDSDLLLLGSDADLSLRLPLVEKNWTRPGVAADLRGVSATGPFALLSQFVGGAREMRAYAAGAALQTDDRMALEFTGPRAMYRGTALDNTTAIRSLLDSADVPAAVSRVVATAADWRDRATMMMRAGAYDEAVKNYREALDRVPSDSAAADGLVAAAIAARQPGEAIRLFDAIAAKRPRDPRIRIAYSKLLAATGDFEAAAVRATEACHLAPDDATAWAQLASVFSDAGAADRLEPIVATMRRIDPAAERTSYYTAAVAFMRGDLSRAKAAVEAAIAVDSSRADAHNLLGAIEASSGRIDTARAEFHRALELNARDSSTYVNLAVLEMNRGDPEAATDWFAEALSLDPGSRAAREGLARARAATGRR